eukprot:symbB.v1.2.012666.t2/scaffold881.1/size155427/5
MRPTSGMLDLGRAIEGGLGGPLGAFEQEDGRNRMSRATELHNRKELWEVRAEIDKEKLRHVAPFPFFGRAMRFQDEFKFAALQITEDGRFSYSFVNLNYEMWCSERGGVVDAARGFGVAKSLLRKTMDVIRGELPQVQAIWVHVISYNEPAIALYESMGLQMVDLEGSESGVSPEDPKVSRVLTYEGVLVSPMEEVPLDEGSARIEGLAMVKHEIEDVGGRARLVSISRSSSRFAIVVSSYFQLSMAVVYSLHLARSPRRPRRTQLPYVGRGMKRDLHATTVRNGDVWRLTQERRRTQKPKFSKSGSTSMLPAAAPSRRNKEDRTSKLTGVASAPQLPVLVDKKDQAPASFRKTRKTPIIET